MGMVPRSGPNPSQGALAGGAAGLGAGFGAFLMKNHLEKKLNADRTVVEEQIRNAPDFQGALTAIENAPFKVKETFGEQLHQRAQERFPETELMNVLTPEGRMATLTHPKGHPLSDEEVTAKGFNPARQFVIVSTDPKGKVEVHDSALGLEAADQDMKHFQEMFPDRKFQVAEGPESETFFKIRDQQLREMDIKNQRGAAAHVMTPEERKLNANVKAEVENDALATENGATVLESKRDEISTRFKDFNGKFKGDIFSLEKPESAALVQNGISTTSTAVARGLTLEKATDLGFNSQIAGSIISNLLKGDQPDSAVAQEAEKRFGVNVETLKQVTERVSSSPQFAQLGEFTPKDPPIIGVPVGDSVVQFIKVNGRIVPYGRRSK